MTNNSELEFYKILRKKNLKFLLSKLAQITKCLFIFKTKARMLQYHQSPQLSSTLVLVSCLIQMELQFLYFRMDQ